MSRYGWGGAEPDEPFQSRLDHQNWRMFGETDLHDRKRNGGSLTTPAGQRYAKAAISVAADWRLTVAGAASGAS